MAAGSSRLISTHFKFDPVNFFSLMFSFSVGHVNLKTTLTLRGTANSQIKLDRTFERVGFATNAALNGLNDSSNILRQLFRLNFHNYLNLY